MNEILCKLLGHTPFFVGNHPVDAPDTSYYICWRCDKKIDFTEWLEKHDNYKIG